jgi:hypothetical protein
MMDPEAALAASSGYGRAHRLADMWSELVRDAAVSGEVTLFEGQPALMDCLELIDGQVLRAVWVEYRGDTASMADRNQQSADPARLQSDPAKDAPPRERRPRATAIQELYRRGIRVGRGWLTGNDYCQTAVDSCGVKRGDPNYSDTTILRRARAFQKNPS